MDQNKAPTPKVYKYKDRVFYKYKKSNLFLYDVKIFKYTTDGKHFRMELLASDTFEVDQFIGLSLIERKQSKTPGVSYSKDAALIAAPEEFINEYHVKQFTYEKPDKKPKKSIKK